MVKICKLKIYKCKLHDMCISDDNIAVKILASKFLMVWEIMTKWCWGQFLLRHPVVIPKHKG